MNGDMKILLPLSRIIFTILLVLLVLACLNATTGLQAGELWQQLLAQAEANWQILAWTAGIAIVLSLVRALDITWNVVFCLLTFALMAELILITAGMKAAVTSPLYATIEAGGYTDIMSRFPVYWWLIPTVWLVACLCSRNQVTVFLTGVVCYALWLLLTWLLAATINMWLGMGRPSPESLATLFRNYVWLPSAMTGTFLLVYSLLMSLFEPFLRGKKNKATPPA